MNVDIGGIGRLQGAAPVEIPSSAIVPLAASPDDHQDAVAVDTLPPSPPPELSGEIAAAAKAYEDLLASGRRPHFQLDPHSGQLTIDLRDRDGNVLCTLSPPEALAIAAGGTPT